MTTVKRVLKKGTCYEYECACSTEYRAVKTRVFRLSDGEEIMTPALFILIQYRSVTDGRTDIGALATPALALLPHW